MMPQLQVNIITPERIVMAKKADSVIVPGECGEMEILPQHAAIFSLINPGQLTVTNNNNKSVFAVGIGFLELRENKLSILVDTALGESDIDVEQAKLAIEEAKDRLAEISPENVEERFAFETQLATAQAKIKVYTKTSTGTDKKQ